MHNQFGFSVDFIFPSELIDLFILQNDFQRIATASYTKILVKHNCLMRSTERVVRVHTQDLSPASLQCFQKFVYLITDLVRENNTLYLCASGNVYYIEHAEDDIQGYIRHNTGNDLVFFPEQKSPNQSDSTTTTSSTTTATNTKDITKREEEEEEEEASERWTSRDDVRDSECGNSSYYDATSEKGDFEDEEEETMDATDNQKTTCNNSQFSDEETYQNNIPAEPISDNEVQEIDGNSVAGDVRDCEKGINEIHIEDERSNISNSDIGIIVEQSNVEDEENHSNHEETSEGEEFQVIGKKEDCEQVSKKEAGEEIGKEEVSDETCEEKASEKVSEENASEETTEEKTSEEKTSEETCEELNGEIKKDGKELAEELYLEGEEAQQIEDVKLKEELISNSEKPKGSEDNEKTQ